MHNPPIGGASIGYSGMAGVAEFERALRNRFGHAAGHGHTTVRAGELHRELSGSSGEPGMQACCGVMWAETAAGACRVVYTPTGGIGGDLEICYALPRPARLRDRRYGRD